MSLAQVVEDFKERELEIIQLMAQGATNQQIAEQLYISTNTVRWYNKQIYIKFDVKSRMKVVNLAREWGILDDEEDIEAEPVDVFANKVSSPKTHNLPIQLNSFIGREADIKAVQELLVTKRLVTITGTAGVGKTRFAIQLGTQVADNYPDSVCFVPLATLANAEFFAKSVATQLGLAENLEETVAETVSNYLANRHMLLILDNFEHVMDAASVIITWLKICPKLTILLTSRELLHWQGEQVYQLQPFPQLVIEETTRLDVFAENDAVQLFINRRQHVQSNRELSASDIHDIGKICQYLEGLPLSIELAAARSNIFSPRAMLDHLTQRLEFLVSGPRDLPQRQQSLRNALAWSFDLLDKTEQELFMRLGIFKGGFTLESVEEICLTDLNVSVINSMASLLNKSLVDVFEDVNAVPRFQMLETMGEYTYEKLVEYEELEAIQRRHAHYYLILAEHAYRERNTNRQAYWINHINLEIDNLRRSLQYFYDTQQPEEGVRILSGLFWCLNRIGYLQEASAWYAKFLDIAARIAPIVKAHALACYGDLVRRMGDSAMSLAIHQSALNFAQESGDHAIQGLAFGYLASYPDLVLEDGRGTFDLAHQAQHHFSEAGDISLLSWSENLLGGLYAEKNDYLNARQHFQIALDMAQELQNANRIATVLLNLAHISILQKDFSSALDLFEDVLAENSKAQNSSILHGMLIYVANIAAEREFYHEACSLLGASEKISQYYGFKTAHSDMLLLNNACDILQAHLTDEEFNQLWQKGFTMAIQESIEYCVNLIQEMRH